MPTPLKVGRRTGFSLLVCQSVCRSVCKQFLCCTLYPRWWCYSACFVLCGPMRSRCAWVCSFASMTVDLGAMTLTLEILWQLPWPKYWCYIGQLGYVDYAWKGKWCMDMSLCPMTFDLNDMTLSLEILWHLLWPKYLYYIDQLGYVYYTREIGVEGMLFCPMTFDLEDMTLTLKILWQFL